MNCLLFFFILCGVALHVSNHVPAAAVFYVLALIVFIADVTKS